MLAVREAPAADLVGPSPAFHTAAVRRAHEALPETLKAALDLVAAGRARSGATPTLADVLEPDATVGWLRRRRPRRCWTRCIRCIGPGSRRPWPAASGGSGTVFRRVRVEHGRKVQRAEARFDGLAGCLRTPAGGSSRQFVLILETARPARGC